MGNARRQAANSKLHHRKTTTSGGIGDWTIVQISYSTEVTLNKQPLGKQLEYRIRAANNAGTSRSVNSVVNFLKNRQICVSDLQRFGLACVEANNDNAVLAHIDKFLYPAEAERLVSDELAVSKGRI